MLGVAPSETADTEGLEAAYGEFAQEAKTLEANYQPETVNTDGWEATQQAWQHLFSTVTVVLCFLHTVMGIVRSCGRDRGLARQIEDKLWNIYQAANKSQFAQRLRRLQEWAKTHVTAEKVLQKLEDLSHKAGKFKVAFDFPGSHRTSNEIDRLMNYQDRILYGMQYFHGTLASARQHLRAMAMLWNFHPYTRKVQAMEPHSKSPFEDLNGFRYHDNWLRNLLIASSLNGRGGGKFINTD